LILVSMVYAQLDRFTLANLDAHIHNSFVDLYHTKAIVDRPSVTVSTSVLVPKITTHCMRSITHESLTSFKCVAI
jgi:hypothetical protein